MNEFLDWALQASGGLGRWQQTKAIEARVRTGGLLVRSRMPGNRLGDYRITVDIPERRTVLDPFPREGLRGIFDHGAVRIESRDGDSISSRSDPRPLFFGAAGLRRNIRWDPLDSVYFAGYAMWCYLAAPYLLTREDVHTAEGAPWHESGETWRTLKVDFPPGIDTHSPSQVYYFDAQGHLRRHDYVALVVGRWARAAHYCADYVEVDGLTVATRRWVLPIGPGNRPVRFPTLVSLQMSDLSIVSAEAT